MFFHIYLNMLISYLHMNTGRVNKIFFNIKVGVKNELDSWVWLEWIKNA